jgi:ABC-type nitrate/sulfonate/bicarbonate transport system ATPase subunit
MSASNGVAVTLNDLSFAYPGTNGNARPVYEGLSLRLEGRMVTALMGASGAGKSTLGKLLSGNLTPTFGEVVWVEEFKSERDRFYMDQDPAGVYSPWLSVGANVREPLRILGWPKDQLSKWSKEIISKFELGPFVDRIPKQLSGGQKSRLALARVLGWMPRAVILDEYLADLDTVTRHRVMEILRDFVAGQGMTVIVISHATTDVAVVADRCLVFGGSPAHVIADIDVAELRSQFDILEVQARLAAKVAKVQYSYAQTN